MTHATDFPLYTARHSQHSAVWTVPGFSMQRFCIACATERLENADELGVHVKKVLNEFQTLLSATNEKGAFVKTITSNARIIEHLSNVLFGQWTVYKFRHVCSCHMQPRGYDKLIYSDVSTRPLTNNNALECMQHSLNSLPSCYSTWYRAQVCIAYTPDQGK